LVQEERARISPPILHGEIRGTFLTSVVAKVCKPPSLLSSMLANSLTLRMLCPSNDQLAYSVSVNRGNKRSLLL